MLESQSAGSEDDVGRERLQWLLQKLDQQHVSQNEVAKQIGIAPSYLTDVKLGRRPLGELFARRLAEAYRLDYRWLMGDLRGEEPAEIGSTATTAGSGSIWVPVLPHPALGSPQAYKAWDGTFFELCGFAAARVRTATYPYILRFGRDDHAGRLTKGDLILVSQATNETAEIQVIKYRNKLYLARRLPDGGWERVAEKGRLVGTVEPAGHAIGIIWGTL
jgi:transcriptional regulator with XRE-family HTH domain